MALTKKFFTNFYKQDEFTHKLREKGWMFVVSGNWVFWNKNVKFKDINDVGMDAYIDALNELRGRK